MFIYQHLDSIFEGADGVLIMTFFVPTTLLTPKSVDTEFESLEHIIRKWFF